ncbi:MAG: hypothetical protein KDD53_05275 [Bdellovibrionales bacterium]|nr:hypothetical protein [Bdellovibrionales bacterium]
MPAKWLPWKYIVRRVARAHGFIDPISVLSYLHRFAQPSEVAEPLELLRAGVVFHARGLMNTRAIQHNLDWVWPYWVERQFDPSDNSFIPRAFSITHVNLTHRNWTAIGLLGHSDYAIVDPKGLVTPHFDGWSIDFWIVFRDGDHLFPSKTKQESYQKIKLGTYLQSESPYAVETLLQRQDCELRIQAETTFADNQPVVSLSATAESRSPAELAVSVRPYNPEGVSFIHSLKVDPKNEDVIQINETQSVYLKTKPLRWAFSNYMSGDVTQVLFEKKNITSIECKVGMATACALYNLESDTPRTIEASIPISDQDNFRQVATVIDSRENKEQSIVGLSIPNKQFEFIFNSALRTLLLFSPDTGELVPGPYTYKRFWFRDAVFMLHPLLCCGFVEKVKLAIENFPTKQTRSGYFLSQEGEWDSNGQVLWIINRLQQVTGYTPPSALAHSVNRGANWILGKRLRSKNDPAKNGLLPAGFSAEHLGNNDYYYWDNFWAIAGLKATSELSDKRLTEDNGYSQAASEYLGQLEQSINANRNARRFPGIPAAPSRRMDAGAIGSLVASYPLQLYEPKDQRILDTVEFLLRFCFLENGFFQDMIHSGINPYLTLHVAQVLLRAGDVRFFPLVQRVAELASPTGHWPEAIHPGTGGGCMGDGHHGWAAAEWVMIIRNIFIREEENCVVLCSGIPAEWIESETTIRFGPTLTKFGQISLTVDVDRNKLNISWESHWHNSPEFILIELPGFSPETVDPSKSNAVIYREDQR